MRYIIKDGIYYERIFTKFRKHGQMYDRSL